MAKTYLYPENLKAKSNLWLWSLQDFLILAVMMLVSVLALAGLGMLFPAAISLCFGFLTIRMGDTTIMDSIKNTVMYLAVSQQYFEWRE